MDLPEYELDFERRRKRRRGLVVLLLSLSLSTLGAGAMSLAIFTDSDASTGAFTAGTIDINTTPAVLFNVTAMMPGDSGQATLNVANSGTGALRYALTSANDNAGLAAAMTLAIDAGACGATTGSLYAGALSGAGFGNVAQGPQANDRALAAGANEDLCFSWHFDINAGNALQRATLNVTWTFAAEQTANNP
jgi:predicted ribosomally synthesized peptide with SipW-like signal peptide